MGFGVDAVSAEPGGGKFVVCPLVALVLLPTISMATVLLIIQVEILQDLQLLIIPVDRHRLRILEEKEIPVIMSHHQEMEIFHLV